MKFVPHDYQTYAIDYIKSHRIAALFLDCGLGKTAITLSAINDLKYDDFDVRKVLIIGPKRVIECTWPEEIKKLQAEPRISSPSEGKMTRHWKEK